MLHWFSFEVNDGLCYCKHISLHTNLYSARLVNIYKPITPHNYIVCFVHPFVWYVCVLHKTIVIAIYKFQDEGKYTDRKSEEVETAAMIW